MNASSALALEAEAPRKPSVAWRILRIALAAGALVLIIRGFAWQQVLASLTSVQLQFLLPILVITPASIVFRSLRWRWVLVDGERIPLGVYIRAYLVGFLANSLLLGKLGDLVKARALVGSGISYASSVASALVDRLLEGLALAIVLGATLLFADLPRWVQQISVFISIASLLLILWLGTAYWKRASLLQGLVRLARRFTERGADFTERHAGRFLDGLEPLTHRRRVLAALAYSMAVWALEIAAVMSFLKAFSVPAPHLLAAILVLVALNFGTLVPVSPGSVGIYQLLCVFALSVWSVDRQLAFSFGLLMQAVLFVPVYLAGAVALLLPANGRLGR